MSDIGGVRAEYKKSEGGRSQQKKKTRQREGEKDKVALVLEYYFLERKL